MSGVRFQSETGELSYDVPVCTLSFGEMRRRTPTPACQVSRQCASTAIGVPSCKCFDLLPKMAPVGPSGVGQQGQCGREEPGKR